MAKEIVISLEAIEALMKMAKEMDDEFRSRVHMIERTLNNAEASGWTDAKFNEMKEDFKDISYRLNEILAKNEDVIIPKLRKVLQNIENY